MRLGKLSHIRVRFRRIKGGVTSPESTMDFTDWYDFADWLKQENEQRRAIVVDGWNYIDKL